MSILIGLALGILFGLLAKLAGKSWIYLPLFVLGNVFWSYIYPVSYTHLTLPTTPYV